MLAQKNPRLSKLVFDGHYFPPDLLNRKAINSLDSFLHTFGVGDKFQQGRTKNNTAHNLSHQIRHSEYAGTDDASDVNTGEKNNGIVQVLVGNVDSCKCVIWIGNNTRQIIVPGRDERQGGGNSAEGKEECEGFER